MTTNNTETKKDNGGDVVLVDATRDSLTMSWPASRENATYVLQYRSRRDGDDDAFVTLSDRLTVTQVKKKNLDRSRAPFQFRVRPKESDSWCTHAEPFRLLSDAEDEARPAAPAVSAAEGGRSITVTWGKENDDDDDDGPSIDRGGPPYELQMRESDAGGSPWTTVGSGLKLTTARKRNLDDAARYEFRVSYSRNLFSPPSLSARPIPLSAGMETLFATLPRGELLRESSNGGRERVHVHDLLPGKIVLLYASAHWCGPCRQYTPQLARFYETHKDKVEVVFLSCDQDEDSFDSYFATMPWTAVPFGATARDELMARIRVTGIPRLVVLNSVTGGVLVNNAVGQQFDVARWKRNQVFGGAC